MTATNSMKQQAHAIIDELPDGASWGDLLYALELRADIEAGLADANANRVCEPDDLRRKFGLLK